MKLAWLIAGMGSLAIAAGCASAGPTVAQAEVERVHVAPAQAERATTTAAPSPEFLPQPLGERVVGQCSADAGVHTVRHGIRVDSPGRLAVTAVVEDGLSAEFMLKAPNGQFTQRAYTDESVSAYSLAHSDASPGAWELVVVCRKGVAGYSVRARIDTMESIGSLR